MYQKLLGLADLFLLFLSASFPLGMTLEGPDGAHICPEQLQESSHHIVMGQRLPVWAELRPFGYFFTVSSKKKNRAEISVSGLSVS